MGLRDVQVSHGHAPSNPGKTIGNTEQCATAYAVRPASIGQPALGNYFDLIACTSTGGIIALGIEMGCSASDILRLYDRHGPSVFGRGLLTRLRSIFRPRYDPRPLRAALESAGSRAR